MKAINARVMECGQPREAYYLGTHTSGTKHYMEIRYYKRQCRKWVQDRHVTFKGNVTLRYCEKVSELGKSDALQAVQGAEG